MISRLGTAVLYRHTHTHKIKMLLKSYLAFQSRLKENSLKVVMLRKLCWFCDCASPEKAQGHKTACMVKKRKAMEVKTIKGGSQKSNSAQALKSKRWNMFINIPRWKKLKEKGESEEVQLLWGREKHAAIENSFCNACTPWRRLTYLCMTHLKKIHCMYIWIGQCW